MNLAIYCADIGSVPKGRFGWARIDTQPETIEQHRGGTEIVDLLDAITDDLAVDRPVALGFECPLFIPVPQKPFSLGMARQGEGNRSWSAGAGAGAMATGLAEIAWLLTELRRRLPEIKAHLDWSHFVTVGGGLFLWEAFVSGAAKTSTHLDDATAAVMAFRGALPDPTKANAVSAERPLSLISAVILWSGWTDEVSLLHQPCLVIKAEP